jgi:protein-S-isoprenylcysteine O-methyltransferase Ste14
MSNTMTAWGVGRSIALISLSYFTLVAILHFSHPKIFVFTQTPYIIFPIVGTIFISLGLIMYVLGARIITSAFHEGKLLTNGVYSIVRHPMYSGLIVFFAPGVALWFRSWLMLTVPVVSYIVFKLFIKKEENYLEEKFGQDYLNYKLKVNALIPIPRFSK